MPRTVQGTIDLRCRECGRIRTVDRFMADGKSARAWFLSVGERCSSCRQVPGQGALFAGAEATAEDLRDRAIMEVQKNANQEWVDLVHKLIYDLPAGTVFNSDYIREKLDVVGVTTHEPRAMGAIMKRMAAKGFAQKKGEYVNSRRKECHGRPIPQWVRL